MSVIEALVQKEERRKRARALSGAAANKKDALGNRPPRFGKSKQWTVASARKVARAQQTFAAARENACKPPPPDVSAARVGNCRQRTAGVPRPASDRTRAGGRRATPDGDDSSSGGPMSESGPAAVGGAGRRRRDELRNGAISAPPDLPAACVPDTPPPAGLPHFLPVSPL